MSPPPTSIDGTELTGATIDGQEVQEITVDGQTVFTAGPDIPDSADLHARYDFSQEDGSLPVSDLSGSGNDLGTGSYSGVTETINGVQAGNFDGTDDILQTTFTTISQPISVFIVYRPDSLEEGDGDSRRLLDGASSTTFVYQTTNTNTLMFAGSNVVGPAITTTPHIFGGIYNSADSILRQDGVQDVTGDVGANSQSGITLGGNGNLSINLFDGAIGEALFYTGDKRSIASDVETFLNNKWSVF